MDYINVTFNKSRRNKRGVCMIKLSESKRLSGELNQEQIRIISDYMAGFRGIVEERYKPVYSLGGVMTSGNFRAWKVPENYMIKYLSPSKLLKFVEGRVNKETADNILFYFRTIKGRLYVISTEIAFPINDRSYDVVQYRWEVPTEIISELEGV